MVPFELRVDKDDLFYTDDNKDLLSRYLLIDKRKTKNEYYKSDFFSLRANDDYIIKKPVTILNKQGRIEYKNMLISLLSFQDKILGTEFPVGYFKEGRHLNGLIVRYYKDGISLDNVTCENNLDLIDKYYYHDEDKIHNIFLLFQDLLIRLYEMFENGVYYLDINEGNIILDNNTVKLIDFDPVWIKFDNKDKYLINILNKYYELIYQFLNHYEISYLRKMGEYDFEKAKIITKSIENSVRRSK